MPKLNLYRPQMYQFDFSTEAISNTKIYFILFDVAFWVML